LGIAPGSIGRVNKSPGNNSIGTAQSLENLPWSLNFDPDIAQSTTLASHDRDRHGRRHRRLLLVQRPVCRGAGIFDIDYGWEGNPATDEFISIILFDSAGNVIPGSWTTSGLPSQGGGGSTSIFDPYLEFVFPEAGTYYIGVGDNAFMPIFLLGGIRDGATYRLQVSIEGHTGVTTTGIGGQTFHFGNQAPGSNDYFIGSGVIPQGDLVSNAFSLKDYSAADKPVMYFNYRMDTATGDHFRVFIQRPGRVRSAGRVEPAAEYSPTSESARLFNDDVWRQARIELDAFARLTDCGSATTSTERSGIHAERPKGVHIDDVIIGFAERGEMITQASRTSRRSRPAARRPASPAVPTSWKSASRSPMGRRSTSKPGSSRRMAWCWIAVSTRTTGWSRRPR
jgi:hypothetical protein